MNKAASLLPYGAAPMKMQCALAAQQMLAEAVGKIGKAVFVDRP